MNPFKIIYYILAVFVISLGLLFIGSVLPIPGNYKLFTVRSGSMEPTIKTGGLVVVKPMNDYNIGDIITFGSLGRDEIRITHRVYDIKVDAGVPQYITKGDANNAPDRETVSEKEVLGRVLLSIPYLGYAVAAVQKPIGFVCAIMVPALFIIGDQIISIIKEIKNKKILKAGQELK